MDVTLLDEPRWKSTFIEPIERVTEGDPIVDFWPYFDRIPAQDFASHDCSAGEVEYVYRMGERFEHVLVRSTTPNVFLAIVLDLHQRSVFGHRLMNFNEVYGIDTP